MQSKHNKKNILSFFGLCLLTTFIIFLGWAIFSNVQQSNSVGEINPSNFLLANDSKNLSIELASIDVQTTEETSDCKVFVIVSPEGYGTLVQGDDVVEDWSDGYFIVPHGSLVSENENILILNQSSSETELIAISNNKTEQYTYYFVEWIGIPENGIVTEDITIVARFGRRLNTYTINFEVVDDSIGFGTIDVSSISANYGEEVSFSQNIITIGDDTVTATPTKETNQYVYSFAGWEGIIESVDGNVTIKAHFSQKLNKHKVTVVASPESYGSVDTTEVIAEYGTNITFENNVLTIGTQTIYATQADKTAEYTYAFVNWTGIPEDNLLSEPITITANFERTPNSYKLTFDANGGIVDTTEKTITYSETYGELPTPTKEGHTFAGWFTSETDGKVVYADSIVEEAQDHILYAHWDKNIYKLTFNPKVEDSSIITKNVEFDAKIEFPNINRTGYTLEGWYNELDCTTKFELTTMPASDLTIYAKWTINKYTISFETNGGSGVNPITQDYNTKVLKPNDTTLTGYEFVGWYTDENFDQSSKFIFDDNTTMPLNGLTLYAKWQINKYTITFNSNAGTEVDSITQDYNTTITKPDDPTKEGYTFAGWFIDNETFENEFEFTTMPASDTTVYAKWNVKQYTITFESNGGTKLNSITQDYNTQITKPSDPTKEGYTFAGWFMDNETFMNAFEFNTMPASNVTIYAKWEINTYTIIATSGENGEISPSLDIEKNYGESQSYSFIPNTGYHVLSIEVDGVMLTSDDLANAIINGYRFENIDKNHTIHVEFAINTFTITSTASENGTINPEGETIKDYGSEQTYTFSPNIGYRVIAIIVDEISLSDSVLESAITNGYTFENIQEDHTIYVEFEQIEFTFTYDKQCNELENEKYKYHYQDTIVKIAEPVRVGYTFLGWFTETGDVGVQYVFAQMPAEDVIVYAKWEINQYSITYNYNDEVTSNKTVEYNYAEPIEKENPTREGFTFGGWWYELTFQKEFVESTMPAENLMLYAKWLAEARTLTLDLNYDNKIATKVFNVAETVVISEIYERVGFTFSGWYNEPECLTAFNYIMPSEDTTIYAKWDINMYTITFETNGGTNVGAITQDFNTTIVKPADPSKIGHTFVGWYLDNNTFNYEFNFIVPASDTVVYAKWIVNQFTIAFETNGGSGVNPITQNYNTKITKPTDPTKEGYTFGGWFLDNNTFANEFEFNTMPANNITLYAKWVIKIFAITATSEGNGSISPNGIVQKEYSQSQLFTFTAEVGYHVSSIKVDDVELTGANLSDAVENGYEFTNISQDHTIHASFEINTYTITASTSLNGTISPNGVCVYEHGDSVTYTITPQAGYNISSITLDDQVLTNVDFEDIIQNGYTFENIDKNHTIHVEFGANKYTITVTFEGNGSVSPNGFIEVEQGENKTFIFTPEKGNYIATIVVDGINLIGESLLNAVSNGYTFVNVSSDHTINIIFKLKQYTITIDVEGNGKLHCNEDIEKVNYGEDRVFKIDADLDKYSVEVYVNGVKVNSVGKEIRIQNVQNNVHIEVRFIKKAFFETRMGILTIVLICVGIILLILAILIITRIRRKRRTRLI